MLWVFSKNATRPKQEMNESLCKAGEYGCRGVEAGACRCINPMYLRFEVGTSPIILPAFV